MERADIHVTVGKDWRSGTRFSVDLVSGDFLKEPHPLKFKEYDFFTLDNLILSSLKLEPFKRYHIKVSAEVVGEIEKE